MLTADYVVQYLLQKMGSDEKNCGIKWIAYKDGHASVVHNVMLYLHTAHTRVGAFVVLSLFKDGEEAHIWEPEIHFSQSPIGHMFAFVAKLIGLKPPKGPETSKELENERLRINLNKLLIRASSQTDLYPNPVTSEVQAFFKCRKNIADDDRTWQYTEVQYENIKQELFRAVTLRE